ncbi:ROK family transcriptional regulator [Streptomyces sp. ASQP_92]|uniref:ROK family transcriptional regulator n=1 Tax=Streptomyces sp. ASQP_92 TaxID=2979116 RepID=UPI0021C12BBD|nr:ROK family transcriptional regulator [Streptomyces sp. ASQP_92]MCT9092033.1 ROK family transcriptional regulator [Streptomyces sp. ASQP_92]
MPASPSTARAINDRLALRLLQDEGPLTAGQLKHLTGLSRPTVADLVERLQGSGLVHVVGESGAERRGPNARLYALVADRAHLAALDVRTEGVSLVVADLLGRTLAEATLPVEPEAGTGPAVEQAVALLERTAKEAGAERLHSVGIGAPGLIDPASGELRDTSGLPAWHRELVRVLARRLPAAVLVENETNLAAVAEQRLGAARGRDTFVLMWLGQGIGAAVVLDGRLRRGASGGAGEIGFMPVPGTGGLPSATGCDGGFHELAHAGAVTRLAAAHGRSGSAEEAVRDADGPFLDALAERLAIGAAGVVAVLDPGLIVLGGELGHAGGQLLAARVQRALSALTPLATEVRPSALGDGAVLSGALLTARDAAQDELFGPKA